MLAGRHSWASSSQNSFLAQDSCSHWIKPVPGAMRFLLSNPAVSQLPFERDLYYSNIVSSTSLLIVEWPREDLKDHPVPTTMLWTGTPSVSSSKLSINLLTCVSPNNNHRLLWLSLEWHNKWNYLKPSDLQFCLPRQVFSLSNHPSGLSLLTWVCSRSHRTLKDCCILSP